MASKQGRLDFEALEKALEDAFDEPGEKSPDIDGDRSPLLVRGKETAGGLDAEFAGKLHEKLAHSEGFEKQTTTEEPTGLLAPCCTKVLSAEELAAIMADDDDEEDETSGKVTKISKHDHGVIDHIDSKLVTELNMRLIQEVTHEQPKPAAAGDSLAGSLQAALSKLGGAPQADAGSVDFKSLSAALEQTLHGDDDLAASFVPTKNGAAEKDLDDAERGISDGLKAPKCTVKLSADTLANLDDDDDDEVVDPALLVAQSGAALGNIDGNLVAELQQKLMAQDEPSVKPAVEAGAIDSSLVSALQQKLEATEAEHDRIDGNEVGCRAPQCTMMLKSEMLAELDDDEDEEELPTSLIPTAIAKAETMASPCRSPRFADGAASPIRSPCFSDEEAGEVPSSGLTAPQCTQVITADMLSGLNDEDDEDEADVQGKEVMHVKTDLPTSTVRADKPKKGSALSGGCSQFDPSFAENLNKKLTFGATSFEPPEVFSDDEEEKPTANTVYSKGLKAPPTTQKLTAGTLQDLDDDDDQDDEVPMKATPSGMGGSAKPVDAEDPPLWRSEDDTGMRAPHTTQLVNADMLADLDDDLDSDIVEEVRGGPSAAKSTPAAGGPKAAQSTATAGGPSAAQLATLSAAALALHDHPTQSAQEKDVGALTMDCVSTAKVMQTARGLADGGWGQQKPPTSSCKLRLAWLSKEEVRKENEQLRKEIESLRAEISMHHR